MQLHFIHEHLFWWQWTKKIHDILLTCCDSKILRYNFCTSSVFQFQILQNLIHDGRLWLIEALFQPDQVMCYKECHGATWK